MKGSRYLPWSKITALQFIDQLIDFTTPSDDGKWRRGRIISMNWNKSSVWIHAKYVDQRGPNWVLPSEEYFEVVLLFSESKGFTQWGDKHRCSTATGIAIWVAKTKSALRHPMNDNVFCSRILGEVMKKVSAGVQAEKDRTPRPPGVRRIHT